MFSRSSVAFWLIVFLVGLAYLNRFVQDDAFISFRYAKNWSDGHGLIWNVGDKSPVEGYTNFLWVILMGMVERVHQDPVQWTMVLGLIFGFGTLVVTCRVTDFLGFSNHAAMACLVLLGTNYTFSSYMTGGLETQAQTFLLMMSVYLCLSVDAESHQAIFRKLVLFSLASVAAAMTRLDSLLPSGLMAVYVLRRLQAGGRLSPRLFLALVVPGLFLMLAWLSFKVAYYGDVLPNTFYVKASGQGMESVRRGLRYLLAFGLQYGVALPILCVLLCYRKIIGNEILVFLCCLVLAWVAYIVKVGGDFMEFRFMVPLLPIVFLVFGWAIFEVAREWLGWLVCLVLVLASFLHASTFSGRPGIESITQLKEHLSQPTENWVGIGRRLHDDLRNDTGLPIIAVTPAGAIPYYSELPTIDMLGLNDRWIARNGLSLGEKAGHGRISSLQYLLDAGVHLVVGHPLVVSEGSVQQDSLRRYFLISVNKNELPNGARVVEIPLPGGYQLNAVYLQYHAAIERAVQARGWRVRPFHVQAD